MYGANCARKKGNDSKKRNGLLTDIAVRGEVTSEKRQNLYSCQNCTVAQICAPTQKFPRSKIRDICSSFLPSSFVYLLFSNIHESCRGVMVARLMVSVFMFNFHCHEENYPYFEPATSFSMSHCSNMHHQRSFFPLPLWLEP